METFGGLDVLVNNLGAGAVRSGFLAVSDEEWQRTFDLNLFSAVRACRAALPALVARGSGAIVNLASVNSFQPDPSVVNYCVAKAAARQPVQGPLDGVRPEGHPCQRRRSGPGAHALLGGPRRGGRPDRRGRGHRPRRRDEIAAAGWGGLALDNFFTEPEEVATLVADAEPPSAWAT